MSDLIRREDAIDAISKLPVKVDDLGYTWMIPYDVLNQIDDIPSVEPELKWIPVTEALPEDRDWYLGIFMESDTGYVIPVPYVCDYVGRETPITTKDFWILRDIDEPHEYHKNLKCVAWLPLPEPWRGEE